jgi:hypothetical protein
MRKVVLTFAFLAAILTTVNSAVAVQAIPTCDPCPYVR